jgi:hypothetical protein
MTIRGHGYGDKHDWEDRGTEESPIPQNRSTLWRCKKCNEIFRHWYHITPDIFEAMKQYGVVEDCNNE